MDKIEIEKMFSQAIAREIEAHEFYKSVASCMADDTAKDVFEQLAKEEMGHMETLEKIKEDPTAAVKFAAPEADYKVAEATELPALSLDMKPAEAIALAMKKEQQAVEFYKDLATQADDAQLKDIFVNLSNMELGHKARLENVFVEIGYPEVF